MNKKGKIFIAFLSLLCTVSILFVTNSSKLLHRYEIAIDESNEEVNELRQEQEWITASLHETITNLFQIHKSNFQVFLKKRIEMNKPVSKKRFYFVSSHNDCGMCVENELFFLDSLAKIKNEEFTILRHAKSKEDYQFFRRNIDRNLNVIQLTESDYKSFFKKAHRFPFYYHKDLMRNPRFFVPSREFPKLSHDFVEMTFITP